MEIEVCPVCGSTLNHMVITTYPTINRKECPNCGWNWEDKIEPVEYIPFQHETVIVNPDDMKVKLDPGAYIPERAHDYDAGLDLRAREEKTVPAHGSATFDTGVHIELPPYTAGFLKSKSGLNVKHNLTSEGVIDVGYTGSICVKLYNHGDTDYHVRIGDKISQLVMVDIQTPNIRLVDKLDETDRGDNGFGSTGR